MSELLIAQEMVSFYIDAEKAVLSGKVIQKDGRSWTRENLSEIRKGRIEWEHKVRLLSRPRGSRGPSLAEF
ncbi:primosomal replication protein PriB/PriC domain protein [Marinagarivorans algicola]|uniref:primosomal replication protein PriB/PriC domain protein n=1 Tax=Marinagarivorans algicola TaxID=1513270 RepID=UPI00192E5EE4|nr:primosomal replication protein PriB/PriC domain protein [Marinagarivorans algicola]